MNYPTRPPADATPKPITVQDVASAVTYILDVRAKDPKDGEQRRSLLTLDLVRAIAAGVCPDPKGACDALLPLYDSGGDA